MANQQRPGCALGVRLLRPHEAAGGEGASYNHHLLGCGGPAAQRHAGGPTGRVCPSGRKGLRVRVAGHVAAGTPQSS